MKKVTCSKMFADYPFAHRQPRHEGHCRLIHGHNWSFQLEFQATHRDDNGFVIDFGGLTFLKGWFTGNFDHTLVLNEDDPWLDTFKRLEADNLAKLILIPNCGAEGLAEYVLDKTNKLVQAQTDGRVSVTRVTVFEDAKNTATATI